ncbi:hypothetical protein NFI96_032345 [Prochilodus magdalenae]|nr:hypothetical protein NFI96_032345 [Prochilodus magdalenae]
MEILQLQFLLHLY